MSLIKRKPNFSQVRLLIVLELFLVCVVIPVIMAGIIYQNIYMANVKALENRENQDTVNKMCDNLDAVFRTIDRAVVNSSLNLELYSYLNARDISSDEDDYFITYLTGMLNGIGSSHKSVYSVYMASAEKNVILTSNDGVWRIQDFYDLSWRDNVEQGSYNISFTNTREISNRFDSSSVPVLSAVWTFYDYPPNDNSPNYIVVNFYEQRLINMMMAGTGSGFGEGHLLAVVSGDSQMLISTGNIYDLLSEQELAQLLSGDEMPVIHTVDGQKMNVFKAVSGFNKWAYYMFVYQQPPAAPSWLTNRQFNIVISITATFGFLIYLLMLGVTNKEVKRQSEELITSLGNAGFSEAFASGPHGRMNYKSGFVAVLVSVDGLRELEKLPIHIILSEAIDTIFHDALNEKRQIYITAKNSKLLRKIFLIQAEGANEKQEDYQQIEEILRTAAERLKERHKVTVSIALSTYYYSKEDVPDAAEEVAETLKYRFLLNGGSILYYSKVRNSQQFYCITDSIRMEMFSCNLSNGRVTEGRAVINKTLAEIESMGIVFYASAVRAFLGFLDAIDNVFKLKNTDFQRVCGQRYNDIYLQIAQSETMRKAVDVLSEILDQYEKYLITVSPKNEEDIVEVMLKYINEHHDREITLSMFAASTYYTESYLSRMFKQRTGENFLQYLTSRRIATAKKMLENPENKILDIAEKLSFGNTKTFIRVFKKFEGITPGQYRKNIISSTMRQQDGNPVEGRE